MSGSIKDFEGVILRRSPLAANKLGLVNCDRPEYSNETAQEFMESILCKDPQIIALATTMLQNGWFCVDEILFCDRYFKGDLRDSATYSVNSIHLLYLAYLADVSNNQPYVAKVILERPAPVVHDGISDDGYFAVPVSIFEEKPLIIPLDSEQVTCIGVLESILSSSAVSSFDPLFNYGEYAIQFIDSLKSVYVAGDSLLAFVSKGLFACYSIPLDLNWVKNDITKLVFKAQDYCLELGVQRIIEEFSTLSDLEWFAQVGNSGTPLSCSVSDGVYTVSVVS